MCTTFIKYLSFFLLTNARVRIDLSEFYECAIKIKILSLSVKLCTREISASLVKSGYSWLCVASFGTPEVADACEEKESGWNSLRKAFP